jgi:hypothetical protein
MRRGGALQIAIGCSLSLACMGRTAGTGAPADTVFSIGINNNLTGPPQAASVVNLRFSGGMPGPHTVVAVRMAARPSIDGDDTDWQGVAASEIPLVPPGAAVGMNQATWDQEWTAAFGATRPYDHGISSVSVRAGYDDERIYFLLQWTDPTENRTRDRWEFDGTSFARALGMKEDMASLAFNIEGSFKSFPVAGCAAACHVAERLGQVTTADKAYRFRMHTNAVGELGDVWRWSASRSNPIQHADDFAWTDVARVPDGVTEYGALNLVTPAGGTQQPMFMGEGGVNSNPDYIFATGVGSPSAVAFDPTGAVAGARIPGWVNQAVGPGGDDIRAVGRWSNGRWTVEFERALITPDPKDAQFPLQEP